jgi:hypothetical protein
MLAAGKNTRAITRLLSSQAAGLDAHFHTRFLAAVQHLLARR